MHHSEPLLGSMHEGGMPNESDDLRSELLEAEEELHRDFLLDLPFQNDDLQLVSRRDDLERKIFSLRAALAPHKKLPPELLAEIFLFCSTPPVVLPPKMDEPLLMLTQVCRAWRELALQIPEFWGCISVPLAQEEPNIQRITNIAEQWICRAEPTYPLSITVECTDKYATTVCENPSLVSSFVDLVVSHAHRLRHFDLAFPSAALLPLFELPPSAFPCLESIYLRPLLLLGDMATPETGNVSAWHWPSTSVTFDSAPLLREVTYSPIPLFKLAELETMMEDVMERAMASPDVHAHPFFAPAFPLPWSQLTTISFGFTALTADAWCSILTECPALAHFEVAIKPSSSDQNGSNSDQRIRLEFLSYLSVSAFSGGGDELIDRIVTPKLNVLILMGVAFATCSLIDFQVRSNFMLETFIPVVQIPTDDVERLFQHLSDVKTLIVLAISTDHFPASFWERVGCSDLLPNLVALLIRPTAVQARVLVDMIEARWEAAVEGSSVAVGFCDVRPAHLAEINDELRRLEKYAESGRAVDILTVC